MERTGTADGADSQADHGIETLADEADAPRELDPRLPQQLWHRWFEAMRRGDVEDAWAVSDAVLAARDPTTRDDPRQPFHRRWVWDGRPFDGRDVLVRCYHGLGDTLQFARFLPPLRDRAGSLRVEVQSALIPLLRCLPGIEFIPFDRNAPTPPSECDIEVMELGHALRASPSMVEPPYLAPPPDHVAGMRASMRMLSGGDRALIGLCWRGGDWSGGRSLPLANLAACVPNGVALINLQGGDGADEAHASGLPFVNAEPLDIADAAAAIAHADLVVTVDTMTAHLAGALARPTWLLLPADCDWRWTRAGDRSPWYPTARLYRQATHGDWSAPLARMTADLAAWTAHRRAGAEG